MKICRYSDDRLGLIHENQIHDITDALGVLPVRRWPVPLGDDLVRNLDALIDRGRSLVSSARTHEINSVVLKSPVANPSKIIGAPANYDDHLAEAMEDAEISHGRTTPKLGEWGLFLKANSSLVGPGEGIRITHPDRRNDHELELAVIIAKEGKDIDSGAALDYVAGYAIGLDMTVRGTEVQSFRKSVDTYSVLGPWLVTSDEIANPHDLDMSLSVNGEVRQDSNTRYLRMNVEQLIAFASSFYTLYPGDVIMTGTPAGVGPVRSGDEIFAQIQSVGEMTVAVE